MLIKYTVPIINGVNTGCTPTELLQSCSRRRLLTALLNVAHLRSQHVFEVVVLLHVRGLLFPVMALITQWHLLTVALGCNTGAEESMRQRGGGGGKGGEDSVYHNA